MTEETKYKLDEKGEKGKDVLSNCTHLAIWSSAGNITPSILFGKSVRINSPAVVPGFVAVRSVKPKSYCGTRIKVVQYNPPWWISKLLRIDRVMTYNVLP